MTLTVLRMFPEVLSSTPFQITFRVVLLTHAPPNSASATTSLVAGAKSVIGANIIGAIHWSIPRFISGGNTGMVWLLNISCLKCVTVSFLLLV